jgi:hypothetical protein
MHGRQETTPKIIKQTTTTAAATVITALALTAATVAISRRRQNGRASRNSQNDHDEIDADVEMKDSLDSESNREHNKRLHESKELATEISELAQLCVITAKNDDDKKYCRDAIDRCSVIGELIDEKIEKIRNAKDSEVQEIMTDLLNLHSELRQFFAGLKTILRKLEKNSNDDAEKDGEIMGMQQDEKVLIVEDAETQTTAAAEEEEPTAAAVAGGFGSVDRKLRERCFDHINGMVKSFQAIHMTYGTALTCFQMDKKSSTMRDECLDIVNQGNFINQNLQRKIHEILEKIILNPNELDTTEVNKFLRDNHHSMQEIKHTSKSLQDRTDECLKRIGEKYKEK